MIPIDGRPFIEYVVEMLRDAGIERILLLLGYLPERIVEHFGDGARHGVRIEYSTSAIADETGTRLRHAQEGLDVTFMLTYCDNYWPVPPAELERAFFESGCPGMLTVYRNGDGYTRDNVRVAGNRVTLYDKSRSLRGLSGVDIGYGIFDRSILACLPETGNPSFEASVYPRLVAEKKMAAYETDHRYYSIGSPDRLPLTQKFLRRDKTVLVDRDGTLNVCMPPGEYVLTWNDWRWIPGSREALARLTSADYRIVVITNQPGVARGLLTATDLTSIHRRMIEEAAAAGARIDAVLACTHGWDDGCRCRKPEPGLLIEAQHRFSLDLTRTAYIGDDDRDEAAARRVGAPFHRVDRTLTIVGVVEELLMGEQVSVSAY